MRVAVIVFLLILISCEFKKQSDSQNHEDRDSVLHLKYAEGFKVKKKGSAIVIDLINPYQGATHGYTYMLVPKNESIPEHPSHYKIIRTPVTSIVCTSTTHVPMLDYLNVSHTLTGFPTTDFISSAKMRAHIDQGNVVDLGKDSGLNLERLVMLKPDVVMGYTMSSDYGQFRKMEELGIPVVLNAEYLEKHPLGRAEWIKYVALFYNKQHEADSIFDAIEKEYLNTKSVVNNVSTKPTVLSGIMYGDGWFLPGGKNYAAQLINDAGLSYLWSDNPSTGYLELGFEAVFEKANNADLWFGVGSFTSLSDLRNANHRYAYFSAFKTKRVYNYDARQGAKGGNEYLELGYLRPDLILKDLVKIGHPELMPAHSLFFYRALK